jgi:hypothetical protein
MSEIEEILKLGDDTPTSKLKKDKARPALEKNKDHYINLLNTYQIDNDKYNKIKNLDSSALHRKIDSNEITLLQSLITVDFDIKGSVISNLVEFGSYKYISKLIADIGKRIFDDELILYYAVKNRNVKVFELILQEFKKHVSKDNYNKYFMNADDNVNIDKYNIIIYLMKDDNLMQNLSARLQRLNVFIDELNLLGLGTKKAADGKKMSKKKSKKKRRRSKTTYICHQV